MNLKNPNNETAISSVWYVLIEKELLNLVENNSLQSLLSIPFKNLESIKHKLGRIQKQQSFHEEHKDKFESLTKREREILVLLAKGSNNPQIAQELFISRNTVEQHRKNLNRKLGIGSFTDIISYALAFDLI